MKTTVNATACSGCRICQIICSLEKEKIILPREARLMVSGTGRDQHHFPKICRHCEDAPCVKSCSPGAIELGGDGLLIFNSESCTKCGECIDACRYSVLKFSERRTFPLVCDGCMGRFPCIERCPTGAISRL